MARKLRLEFPGAIYHVINRGNYRSWVFKTVGSRQAFEECLFEVCEKSRWVLHSYVIMGNHFHLALETPEGNLCSGMQWLQSTFANRFNRLRGARGHLFQGRFKSLLVEEGPPLFRVCHYIHLNPVRAGIVPVARLGEYRHSSYWYLWHPKARPKFLQVQTSLQEAGGFPDDRRGWEAYAEYLAWEASEGPAGNNPSFASHSRGWALGSAEFKSALLKDHAIASDSRAWDAGGARQLKETQWQEALEKALRRVPTSARRDQKRSAPWKVAVAAFLKQTTNVSNGWLAKELDMGSGFYVSKHVGLLRKTQRASLDRIEWVKGKE